MTKPSREVPGLMGQEPRRGSVWSLQLERPLDLSTQAYRAASERNLSKFYSVTCEPSKVKRNFLTMYSYVFFEDITCHLLHNLLTYQDSMHCLSMPSISKDPHDTILTALHFSKKKKLSPKVTSLLLSGIFFNIYI